MAQSYTSVQFSHSFTSDSLRPSGLEHDRSPCPSITNSWSLFKLMSIESVMSSNHLIFWHPFPLPSSIFPSIRVFSNVSALEIWWPKYWCFSISPSNEYSGLTFFRMDWFDLLAVQGTLNSLLQHHSSKSINSLMLSLLYGPSVTSVPDYRKNFSFDYMNHGCYRAFKTGWELCKAF